MAKGDFLGEFEQVILLAVLRLTDTAYGMEVRREIETRTGRETSIGAVYATLDRLESKALVRSREQVANDRPRKLYHVTAEGNRALAATHKAAAAMWDGVKVPGV
jgi:DNA-binding PadR family transcriptional regulator